MKKLLPFALAPMSLVVAGMALADDDKSLPETVVTASRVEQPAAAVPASTTVITRKEIEARQSTSLAQLLSLAGGIDVAANGGPASSTSVFMRGTNSNHVLVLIDGVRANSANDGRFDFSLLRPADIERIEIVRGARSAQYGSDAIGGVIQIFTRKTARNFVALKAGSFHTQEAQVGVGAEKNGDHVSLTASYADQDGFSATRAGNPDRDGQHDKSAQISAGKRLGEQTSLEFSALRQDRRVEFDQGVTDEQLSNGRIALHHDTTVNWKQTVEVGYNQVERDTNALRASRLLGSWVNQISLGDHGSVIAGIDYQQESIDTGSLGYDKTVQSHGGFITLDTAVQQLGISISGRHDDHERFGGHDTGSLTLSHPLTDSIHVYGTVASAFKAPTADQLYSPGDASWCWPAPPGNTTPCYAGNPNLQPERSRQRELGLRWQVAPDHQITANLYDNKISNLIASDFTFPNPYVNINRARIKGLEVTASGQEGIFSYQLNAGSLKAKDDTGADLLRRPRGSLNGLLMLQPAASWSVGTEVVARSHAKDFGATGIERVPGYTVVNLLANWQVTPKLTLGVRADNVTDKQYVQAIGYNTADRSGYVTARYTF